MTTPAEETMKKLETFDEHADDDVFDVQVLTYGDVREIIQNHICDTDEFACSRATLKRAVIELLLTVGWAGDAACDAEDAVCDNPLELDALVDKNRRGLLDCEIRDWYREETLDYVRCELINPCITFGDLIEDLENGFAFDEVVGTPDERVRETVMGTAAKLNG